VKPPAFGYHRPRTVEEALDVLADLGAEGKVLAGGQSLVPLMSMRLAAPAHLVDVNHLPGLDTIEVDENRVRVGALVRHSALEHHDGAYGTLPLLRQALRLVAHPTIRNRGTTVGSLVHGDPAAELPAVLLLLDGTVTLRSTGGSRDVVAHDFFIGPMQSDVRPDELAVAATFAVPPAGSGTSFVELSRRHGDYAMCGVAAMVTRSGREATARVALLGVGDGPVLVDVTEATVDGRVDAHAVAGLVDAAIDPADDIHATADYRRHLAHVLVGRALHEAGERAA
jgi:aerobic carbon-monoxide dehydrogenase medium subunit